MKRYLWVIEMKVGDNWEPTICCNLTKEDAKQKKGKWKRNNPSDKFRVCKYVPEEKP